MNVTGTQQLLAWAETLAAAPRFILLSTTCVAGTRIGEIEEAALPDEVRFVNHYEHTKWHAEQVALSSPLRPEIVRLATVVGSLRNGELRRPGAFHTTLRWLHAGLLPIIPGNDTTRLDLLPTECAVQFLTRLVTRPARPGTVYHVSNGREGIPVAELLTFAIERFSRHSLAWRRRDRIAPVLAARTTFDEFRNSVLKTRDALFTRVLESVDAFLPELFYPKTYSTTRAEDVWGGPLPLPDWHTWIGAVVDSAVPESAAQQAHFARS